MLLFDLVTEAGMYLLMIVLGKGMGMWNVPQKKTKEEQEKVYLYCGHMISILTLVMVVMFGYMTVCNALGVSLGNGFIWFSLVGTIVPAIYYTVKMYN